MLDLKNVTLVATAWGNLIEHTTGVLEHCSNMAKFGDIKMVAADHIKDEESYNKFMLYELIDYVDTDFCINVQYDGFIINPDLWTDEFFNYDYIGACWHFMGSKNNVGNGGFSLRSKKLLQEVSKLSDYDPDNTTWHTPLQAVDRPLTPEDWFICYHSYDKLIDKGIKFAPVELARRFSVENPGILSDYDRDLLSSYKSFGFHDKKNKAAMETYYDEVTTR